MEPEKTPKKIEVTEAGHTQPSDEEVIEKELGNLAIEGEENAAALKEHHKQGSRFSRFKHWYGSRKKISIPLTLLALTLIIAAIPWARYKSAGAVYKKDFSLTFKDSKANAPVSGVTVTAGNMVGVSDAEGKVTFDSLSVGPHKIKASKKYYQDKELDVLVPIFGRSEAVNVSLVATGRQAKIVITNIISGKALGDVEIEVADSEALTDKNGGATVVLPAGSPSQKATLALDGYNPAEVEIKVDASKIVENKFTLTPKGSIYFMSKRTGKLDVMKVNLDGTEAKVAVAGTGAEKDDSTKLIQSPDGKYAALVTRRNSIDPSPQLYVISASDDKLLMADSGNANFTLLGWAGDRLVYIASHNDLTEAQAGKYKLKSYDASSGKITSLAQSDESDLALGVSHKFDFVRLSGGTVVFARTWYGAEPSLAGKVDSLHSISVNGQNHRQVITSDAAAIYTSYSQRSPVAFYIRQRAVASGQEAFQDFTVGGTAKQANISPTQMYEKDYGYFFSPSGRQTVWSEERDGQMAFLVGDATGSGAKVIATLDEYIAESWFSEDYLLLSKKSSELYIMAARGDKPLKITNYQSTYNFY